MKVTALNQEIFSLYWKGFLQMRTPEAGKIADYITMTYNHGSKEADFLIVSNFQEYGDKYEVNQFINQHKPTA